MKGEEFLNRDTDGRAAPPDRNHKGWSKTAGQDLVGQLEGVLKQSLGCQVYFVHGREKKRAGFTRVVAGLYKKMEKKVW
jgi:hypothetical protein